MCHKGKHKDLNVVKEADGRYRRKLKCVGVRGNIKYCRVNSVCGKTESLCKVLIGVLICTEIMKNSLEISSKEPHNRMFYEK